MKHTIRYRFKVDDQSDIQSKVEKYRFHLDLNGYSPVKTENSVSFKFVPEAVPKIGELLQNAFEPLRSGTVDLKLKDNNRVVEWNVNVISIVIRSLIIGFVGALIYNYYISPIVLNSILSFVLLFILSSGFSYLHLRSRISFFNSCVFE